MPNNLHHFIHLLFIFIITNIFINILIRVLIITDIHFRMESRKDWDELGPRQKARRLNYQVDERMKSIQVEDQSSLNASFLVDDQSSLSTFFPLEYQSSINTFPLLDNALHNPMEIDEAEGVPGEQEQIVYHPSPGEVNETRNEFHMGSYMQVLYNTSPEIPLFRTGEHPYSPDPLSADYMEQFEEYQNGLNQLNRDFNDSSSNHSDDSNFDWEGLPVTESFSELLRQWAVGEDIRHSSLKSLLDLLRNHGHEELPKDPRTLLKTPRSTDLKDCPPGKYLHVGLEKGLRKEIRFHNIQERKLIFDINVDGVSLRDKGTDTMWPILGKIRNIRDSTPFVIGLYRGPAKPSSSVTFLDDFVNEYNRLTVEGFTCDNQQYTCCMRCAICDAPARCFVKCTKQHNAYYGCDKCIEKGFYSNHRMKFLSEDQPLRTDESFRQREQPEHHHHEKSKFEETSLDMVAQFPLDPMHLVFMGVVRLLIILLIALDGSSGVEMDKFDDALVSMAKWMPKEFNRKTDSIYKLKNWKATMYRFFLLYALIVLGHNFLPQKYAEHAFQLVCAIRILCDPSNYKSNNTFAKTLLHTFVKNWKKVYGPEHVVYNVHGLTHIADDALRFGPLDSYSAFPYENHMKTVKSLVRKPEDPLPQAHRRLAEQYANDRKKSTETFPILKHSVPLQLPLNCVNRFRTIVYRDFMLSDTCPNNFCILKDKSIVVIQSFGYKEEKPVIIGRKFNKIENIPHFPIDSVANFDIGMASELSELQTWDISLIYRKIVLIVCNKRTYVMPLLHR